MNAQQAFTQSCDVLIVGAGPAGLSAAIYTSRRALSTLIISQDVGGQAGQRFGEVEHDREGHALGDVTERCLRCDLLVVDEVVEEGGG